jgi:hypothetical protein
MNRASSRWRFSWTYAVGSKRGDLGVRSRPRIDGDAASRTPALRYAPGDGERPRVGVVPDAGVLNPPVLLALRPTGGRWCAGWRSAHGRWYDRSTEFDRLVGRLTGRLTGRTYPPPEARSRRSSPSHVVVRSFT